MVWSLKAATPLAGGLDEPPSLRFMAAPPRSSGLIPGLPLAKDSRAVFESTWTFRSPNKELQVKDTSKLPDVITDVTIAMEINNFQINRAI